MVTGCVDEDLVTEYNKLAVLVNHSRQFTYIVPFAIYMMVVLLLMATFKPFTGDLLVCTLGTRAFSTISPHWLSSSAAVLNVIVGIETNPYPKPPS